MKKDVSPLKLLSFIFPKGIQSLLELVVLNFCIKASNSCGRRAQHLALYDGLPNSFNPSGKPVLLYVLLSS